MGLGYSESTLHAFDAATGAELWQTTSRPHSLASPAVVDGVVFAEHGTDLVALEVRTGKRRWRRSARGVGSTVVADGVVYYRQASTLYAVDARTGDERWRFGVGPGTEENDPIVAGGFVFVAGDVRYVYAIGGSE